MREIVDECLRRVESVLGECECASAGRGPSVDLGCLDHVEVVFGGLDVAPGIGDFDGNAVSPVETA